MTIFEMYEHRKHRLLPWPAFLWRAGRHVLWALLVVVLPWLHRLFHWLHVEDQAS